MSEYKELKSLLNKIVEKQKPILIALGAIVIFIAGIFYMVNYFLPERENEAQSSMYMAQFYFENEQYQKALNGEGKNKGFKYISENYSFTKANNLAKLYRGICELNLGKFDDAISSLKGFNSNLDELQAISYNGIGDSYAEKKDMNQAIEYYIKASDASNNGGLSPKIILKTAKALEHTKKYKEAYEMYNSIKTKFPNSQEADIAEILMNQVANAK